MKKKFLKPLLFASLILTLSTVLVKPEKASADEGIPFYDDSCRYAGVDRSNYGGIFTTGSSVNNLIGSYTTYTSNSLVVGNGSNFIAAGEQDGNLIRTQNGYS